MAKPKRYELTRALPSFVESRKCSKLLSGRAFFRKTGSHFCECALELFERNMIHSNSSKSLFGRVRRLRRLTAAAKPIRLRCKTLS